MSEKDGLIKSTISDLWDSVVADEVIKLSVYVTVY